MWHSFLEKRFLIHFFNDDAALLMMMMMMLWVQFCLFSAYFEMWHKTPNLNPKTNEHDSLWEPQSKLRKTTTMRWRWCCYYSSSWPQVIRQTSLSSCFTIIFIPHVINRCSSQLENSATYNIVRHISYPFFVYAHQTLRLTGTFIVHNNSALLLVHDYYRFCRLNKKIPPITHPKFLTASSTQVPNKL